MCKILLSGELNSYKANLHCHTTVSDGVLTPEEFKEHYKANGYSVVAFTDHDIFIPHPELNDDSFLALNGFELSINGTSPGRSLETCHIGYIALEPENVKQVCYHREKYVYSNAVNYRDKVKIYDEEPDYERVYTPECINDMIKIGKERGFFVTYNHPTWSLENYEQYMNYHGMHAMEIYNNTCYLSGYEENNARVYEDMLKGGEKLYCLATDDGHRASEACGGFVVIRAANLEYRTITKALLNGSFYSSTGPEIKSIWYEDGKVHVETSNAKRIAISYNNRRAFTAFANADKPATYLEAPVFSDTVYFRVTVTDEFGNYAYSNAYFKEDLTQ